MNSRLLVVRTIGRNRFYLPGGKPEPGESLAEALKREIAEELGVTIDPQTAHEEFVVRSVAHGRQMTSLQMHCFRADALGAPAPRGEIEELAWLAGADHERCAPALREVLRRLRL